MAAVDLALNRVELSNALNGLLRHRRAACLVQIVKLAANVRLILSTR
jgi:hypothetical protein